MEGQSTEVLGMAFEVFVQKAIVLAVAVVIALVVQHFLVRAAKRALDSSKVPSASIFINLIRALIWVVALLSILEPVFGVSPTAFVAAFGITSLIISFGMQDTVANVVSGLGLMLGHVIQPGDYMTFGGMTGVVTDVTWRSTVMRDRMGREQIIPNSQLNKTSLVKLPPLRACECTVDLEVFPDSDLDQVTADIERAVPEALGTYDRSEFGCQVYFVGSTSDGISCSAHIHVADGMAFDVARNKVMRELGGKPWLSTKDL